MKDKDTVPLHWSFAVGQACAGLEELVRSFDFLGRANGHTYAGVEPKYLTEVIDGFLSEPDDVVPGGNRATLLRLRQLLVERIQPAHEQGLVAGRQHWHDGDRVYGSVETEELHRLALQAAPADEMVNGWFAEGFCVAYSSEEMESLRRAGSR